MSFRNRPVAAIRVPDPPVVAEHQERAFKTKFVVALVGELFAESAHRRVHRGMLRRDGLLHIKNEPKIAVGFFSEKVGARRNRRCVSANDHAVFNRENRGVAFPTAQAARIEKRNRFFGANQFRGDFCSFQRQAGDHLRSRVADMTEPRTVH